MSNDGKFKNGKQSLLQLLMYARCMDGFIIINDLETPPMKIMRAIVPPIARLFGYRA